METLLKLGEANVVYELWDSEDEGSFKAWKNAGATTLWESWKNARSHNHPMFGAFVKCFFEYILGIQRKESGYKKVEIRPLYFEKIAEAEGKIQTEAGEIAVAFSREKNGTEFLIDVPTGMEATFVFEDIKETLSFGRNKVFIEAKNS